MGNPREKLILTVVNNTNTDVRAHKTRQASPRGRVLP